MTSYGKLRSGCNMAARGVVFDQDSTPAATSQGRIEAVEIGEVMVTVRRHDERAPEGARVELGVRSGGR